MLKIDSQALETLIDQQIDPESFSGVVRLSDADGTLFECARGLADHTARVPNRPGTRFQIASGSKIFTSLAICRLVQERKLEFETPLVDCVADHLPNYSSEITIRHLLTHTSGVTSYFEEDVNPDYESLWRDAPVYRFRQPRDFLPLLRDKPVRFEPGARFEYNDGGYILLGLVVESISGMGYHEYVTEHVIRRAGMKDSGFFRSDQLPEGAAQSYIRNPDGSWRTNVFAVPVIGAPDGGAYSTALDVEKLWRALLGCRILDPERTAMVFATETRTGLKDPESAYGLGVWIDGDESRIRKYFLSGYDPGVAFRSAYYKDPDVILSMLGNTQRGLWPLFDEMERALAL